MTSVWDEKLYHLYISPRIIKRLGILIEYMRQNKAKVDLDYRDVANSHKLAQKLAKRFFKRGEATRSDNDAKLFVLARKINASAKISWSIHQSGTSRKLIRSSNVKEAVGRVMPYILEMRFVMTSTKGDIFALTQVRLAARRTGLPKDEIEKAEWKKEDRNIEMVNTETLNEVEKREKTETLVRDKNTFAEHQQNLDVIDQHGFFVEGGTKATSEFLTLCDTGERIKVKKALEAVDSIQNILTPIHHFVDKMRKGVEFLIASKFVLDPSIEHSEEDKKKCEHFCPFHCPEFINIKKLSLSEIGRAHV